MSRLAADNPAHRGITPEAFCVVHILIPRKPPKHRLPQHRNQRVPTVPAGARIREHLARHRAETERIVDFPISDQSSAGSDHRSAKLEHEPAVKIRA
jgi:hypothetical protein